MGSGRDMQDCRACGADELGEQRILHEMMFASREPFAYRACAACGCLQIVEPPASIAEHYGPGYYSFADGSAGLRHKLRDWLTLNLPQWFGKRFDWFQRGDWRSVADLPRRARILDVGCGAGEFVFALRGLGYDVRGTDPFLERPVLRNDETIIDNRDIAQIDERFDAVMMHHSLEHIFDQVETLRQVKRILRPGGTAIIRVPVIDSWAAEEFGDDWAHLDPPRHFYLHTRASLRKAAERAGLVVREIRDDFNVFGVRGSLQVRHGRGSASQEELAAEECEALIAQQRLACASGRADTVTMFAVA